MDPYASPPSSTRRAVSHAPHDGELLACHHLSELVTVIDRLTCMINACRAECILDCHSVGFPSIDTTFSAASTTMFRTLIRQHMQAAQPLPGMDWSLCMAAVYDIQRRLGPLGSLLIRLRRYSSHANPHGIIVGRILPLPGAVPTAAADNAPLVNICRDIRECIGIACCMILYVQIACARARGYDISSQSFSGSFRDVVHDCPHCGFYMSRRLHTCAYCGGESGGGGGGGAGDVGSSGSVGGGSLRFSDCHVL
jgi:hypothetical protein